MPNNMIKRDAERGEGSKKTLEHDWDEAKKDAKKSTGKDDSWALVNYIYQNRKKSHHNADVVKSAVARILEDEEQSG